jgi:hypothetical protein
MPDREAPPMAGCRLRRAEEERHRVRTSGNCQEDRGPFRHQPALGGILESGKNRFHPSMVRRSTLFKPDLSLLSLPLSSLPPPLAVILSAAKDLCSWPPPCLDGLTRAA